MGPPCAICLIVAPLTLPLEAASLPGRPVSVGMASVAGVPTLVVQWGSIAASIPRQAADCDAQWERLIEMFGSAPTRALLGHLQKHLQGEEAEAGEALGRHIRLARASASQASGLPERQGCVIAELPLPGWVESLPPGIRRTLRLGLFDARSAKQRSWALAARLRWRDLQLVALGYPSIDDLDGWQGRHPSVRGVLAVTDVQTPDGLCPARAFAASYRVGALPAVVSFPHGDRMVRQTGLALTVHASDP